MLSLDKLNKGNNMSEFSPRIVEDNENINDKKGPSNIRKLGAAFIASLAVLGIGKSIGTDRGDIHIDKQESEAKQNPDLEKFIKNYYIEKGDTIEVMPGEFIINVDASENGVNLRTSPNTHPVDGSNNIIHPDGGLIGASNIIKVPGSENNPNGPWALVLLEYQDGRKQTVFFSLAQAVGMDAIKSANGDEFISGAEQYEFEGTDSNGLILTKEGSRIDGAGYGSELHKNN